MIIQIKNTKYIIVTYENNNKNQPLYLSYYGRWIAEWELDINPNNTQNIKQFKSERSAKTWYKTHLKMIESYNALQNYPLDNIIIKPIEFTANVPR